MLYFEDKRFREVNIEVTNLCDFNCWFCPRHAMTRPKGMMDFERFKELIGYLGKATFLRKIAMAGIGEPTLHKDIIKMISFIKNTTPFRVVLTTNGNAFSDESFIVRLFDTGIDKITVSLRISNPTFNKSGLPAAFDYERYVESVLRFVKAKFDRNYNTEIELSFFKETYYSKYILGIRSVDYIDKNRLGEFIRRLSETTGRPLPSYSFCTKGLRRQMSNVDRIPVAAGLSLRFDSLSGWTTASEKMTGSQSCYRAHYGSCLGMLTHFGIFWNGDASTCCADFDAKNCLGNIFREKGIINMLLNERSIRYAKSLRSGIMPTVTCEICRGGRSRREKWANMLGTILFLNKT